MKKMVCEICGSQQIKKENGVFVCQECGTEYSLEEAKKLLIEVGEPTQKSESNSEKTAGISTAYKVDKNELLQYLSSWLQLIAPFENTLFWTGLTCNEPITNEYVQRIIDTPKLLINDIEDEMFCDPTKSFGLDFLRLYNNVNLRTQLNTVLERTGKTAKLLNMINNVANNQFYLFGGVYTERRYAFRRAGDRNYYYFDGFKINGNIVNSTSWVVSNAIHNNKFYIYEQYLAPIMKNLKRKDATLEYDVDGVFQEIRGVINLFKNRHAELKKYYEDNFDVMIEEYKKIQREIQLLNEQFPLPQKYRNSAVIVQLMDYLEDGRAESWKELINLFEMEGNFSKVISKLDSIDTRLSAIHTKLSAIEFHLSDISSNISGIYSKINEINICAKNIMFDTRYQLIRSII